jgi:glycosyltransferase involved in cell wall biosynthesis
LDATVVLMMAADFGANQWRDADTARAVVERIATADTPGEVVVVLIGQDTTVTAKQGGIRFVPYQVAPADLARYLQAADVYVHPAKADTAPLITLQAMACGTAVVASAVGGIPEQIDHGTTGVLVPPNDAAALAAAVLRLVLDHDFRRLLGCQAADTARDRFDFRACVAAYLGWYEEILARHERYRRQSGVAEP